MYNKKPTIQYEIDWSHPLANKLAICVIAGREKELVHGFDLKYRNGAKLSTNVLGQVLDTTTTTTAVIELVGSDSLDLQSDDDFSVYSRQIFGSDIDGTIISKRYNAASNWQVYTSNGGVFGLKIGNTDLNSNHTVVDGDDVGYGSTWNSSGTCRHYVDGLLNTTNTLSATANKSVVPISIGTRWGTSHPTTSYQGDIEASILIAWYDRLLTDEDMFSLHNDPYQILKSIRTVRTEHYAAIFGTEAVDDTYEVTDGSQLTGNVLDNDTALCP